MKKELIFKLFIILILFIICFIVVRLFLGDNDFVKYGKVYINEIMLSNNNTIKDDDNEYSDYIELYNSSNKDINLDGYYLSDSEYEFKWSFSNTIIKKKSYLIVYASGKDKCNDNICHTNFKLSSEGETVVLLDHNTNLLSKVIVPSSTSDITYGFYNNSYYFMNNPTPGKENDKTKLTKSSVKKGEIIINEYMSHNNKYYLDNGGYYDFIEIYNKSKKDLNLNGLYLSDDINNLNKFKLYGTIKKGEYLVIYLTGGVKVDNYYCANFKLSDDDKDIVLSNNGKVIDRVSVVKLNKNISYGLYEDKWYYFTTPTIGSENNTYHYLKEEINGSS